MSYEKFRSCIEACYECAMECDRCATACLQEEDLKMMKRCIELDMYCSGICRTAASFMAMGEMYSGQICRLCAEICQACGEECAKHKYEHCQRCSEACKSCAAECNKIAA